MEWSFDLIQAVEDVVLHPDFFSAAALFVVAMVNELFVLLPYTIILSGQLLFMEGSLSLHFLITLLVLVAVPVGIGTTIGSLPIYALAFFGGKSAIDKFGKYLKVTWEDVERLQSRFKGSRYDEIFFLVLRSIPLLPSLPVNVVAGIIQMRLESYLGLTIIGTIIKMMIMFIFVGLGVETLAQ